MVAWDEGKGEVACLAQNWGVTWGAWAYSEVTNACSLMVCSTSRNLILEVSVWPW